MIITVLLAGITGITEITELCLSLYLCEFIYHAKTLINFFQNEKKLMNREKDNLD